MFQTLRASLWSGTAQSWVDLSPTGSTASIAYKVHNSQQVGVTVMGSINHASLWTGTAASWVDLNPAGSTESEALDVYGGMQVGFARIGGIGRASLWSGTAASWTDLSLTLPGSWGSTGASGIWADATTLYVVGSGFNNLTGRTEALLWMQPIPAPGSAWILAFGGLIAGAKRRRD